MALLGARLTSVKGALRDDDICLFVCLSVCQLVCLSPFAQPATLRAAFVARAKRAVAGNKTSVGFGLVH